MATLSEQYKADLISFFKPRVLWAATSTKEHVYDTIKEIIPQKFEVKNISDELDEVTFISGMERTVINFHWKPKASKDTNQIEKYWLHKID